MTGDSTRSVTADALRAAVDARSARWAAGIAGFAVLTALGARVAIPLPGTPVPFTFQVVAVLLAGYLMGPAAGAASQAVYLAAGVAGLPVFAAGGGAAYLVGPTGGYLLAYPAAAALAGAVARRNPGILVDLAGLVGALALIYGGGAGWLALVVDGASALEAGVLPFLAMDLVKVFFVLLVGRGIGKRARRFFA